MLRIKLLLLHKFMTQESMVCLIKSYMIVKFRLIKNTSRILSSDPTKTSLGNPKKSLDVSFDCLSLLEIIMSDLDKANQEKAIKQKKNMPSAIKTNLHMLLNLIFNLIFTTGSNLKKLLSLHIRRGPNTQDQDLSIFLVSRRIYNSNFTIKNIYSAIS